jgi:multidrug efflux pump subunit AcrA (membrane-fusion protein)
MKALAVIVILSGAAACSRDTAPMRSDARAAIDVRVATAAVAAVPQTFEAGGVVAARMTAQMSPRIAAELRELTVQPGDRVRKGQILAVLDDRDLAANRARAHASVAAAQSGAASAGAERESAEARLALARANHQRIEQLRDRNSATPQELDRATAELHMADAGVRAARARVDEASASITAAQAAGRSADATASFSTIAAPFDGLVTNRLLEPGNMAAPGTPLLTVETTDGFRLEVQVDAARARALNVGDAVTVELEGQDEADTLTGRVVEVARAIDPGTHAFVVKIQLPAGTAVRSGTFARARFERGERNALVVPESALVRRGQLSLVFVVDSSRHARMRAITPGARAGDSVEVLAGIQPGETVVVNPPAPLVDGSEVRPLGGRP